jgi:hypothetical protein
MYLFNFKNFGATERIGMSHMALYCSARSEGFQLVE